MKTLKKELTKQYNYNMDNIKDIFLPGDIVTIRQKLANKPEMIVVKKMSRNVKTEHINTTLFLGILCR